MKFNEFGFAYLSFKVAATEATEFGLAYLSFKVAATEATGAAETEPPEPLKPLVLPKRSYRSDLRIFPSKAQHCSYLHFARLINSDLLICPSESQYCF